MLEKVVKYNGKEIHPDLIIIDLDEKSLCVADYKHFIGPITASEVDYKMSEIKKGLTQVENYVSVLERINKLGLIDIINFKVHGILLTHKPLPVPIPDSTLIPVTDISTFMTALNQGNNLNSNLTKVIQKFMTDKTDNSQGQLTVIETEIKVQDWIIKRQQHKIV